MMLSMGLLPHYLFTLRPTGPRPQLGPFAFTKAA